MGQRRGHVTNRRGTGWRTPTHPTVGVRQKILRLLTSAQYLTGNITSKNLVSCNQTNTSMRPSCNKQSTKKNTNR